jgi:hypothetical protein
MGVGEEFLRLCLLLGFSGERVAYKFIQFLLHSGITNVDAGGDFLPFFSGYGFLFFFFPFYCFLFFSCSSNGGGEAVEVWGSLRSFYTSHFCWQFFHHQRFNEAQKSGEKRKHTNAPKA